MKIGIDLDNTLIFYDDAFRHEAIARGLLPKDFAGGKQQLRDALRRLEDGETKWQQLQGHVYGQGLERASWFEGAEAFLKACRKNRAEIYVVSHKTEFGHFDAAQVNLRDAARHWLSERGLFTAHGMPEKNLVFAATRAEKVSNIAALSPDWFIDDLPEVYAEPHFPPATKKILFSPGSAPKGDWILCKSWRDIERTIFP